MSKKLLFFFQVIALLLFALFAIEIIILHPRNLSFRGLITEKLFFWGWILFGFLGFGAWRFGIALLSFLGLTMVPMMIPFLCLIPWSCSSNKSFEMGNQERLEEVWAFGQYFTYLYWVKPDYFFLEHYYQKVELGGCEGGRLQNIQLQTIEQKATQLTLHYILKDSTYHCTLPIKSAD